MAKSNNTTDWFYNMKPIDHKLKMRWDRQATLAYAVEQETLQIAKKCKESGLSTEVLARATKLTNAEIEKL